MGNYTGWMGWGDPRAPGNQEAPGDHPRREATIVDGSELRAADGKDKILSCAATGAVDQARWKQDDDDSRIWDAGG